MFYISEIERTNPTSYQNELQKMVYLTVNRLGISFERVATDKAITMEDCILINEKLNCKMVKTLFMQQAKDSFLSICN